MKILDVTAGSRSIWYQKNNPFTVFTDQRKGKIVVGSPNMKRKHLHNIRVNPHILCRWDHLPFQDSVFDMVIFDPPHIYESKQTSALKSQYGSLNRITWRSEIENGNKEMFRCLKENGILILKWNESDIPLDQVLNLMSYPPMFGTRTGQSNNTHWVCFIKYNSNHELSDFNK